MCPAWLLVLTLNRRRNHDERYIFGLMMLEAFFVLGIGAWALINGCDVQRSASRSMH